MNKAEFISRANALAGGGVPFLFVIDFECAQLELHRLDEIDPAELLFKVQERTNDHFGVSVGSGAAAADLPTMPFALPADVLFDPEPIPYEKYLEAFTLVQKHILHGNSFLLNLTFPTRLTTNLSLEQIYRFSHARYKLYLPNRFVVFSPETFVQIRDHRIWSNPMKGTIDAAIDNAEAVILADRKEAWEHNTIVDLIRNDLSMVAKDVRVDRFRYVEEIRTNRKKLLQVSSEISGDLQEDWRKHLGDILLTLLPAGSVSGAPKRKTVEVIRAAEGMPRGFYTGIFGIFDGNSLDSAVMIRYIEQVAGGLQYRSGGGITGHSQPETEYREMIDKVYVPII